MPGCSGRPLKVFPNKRKNQQYDARNLESAIKAVKERKMTQKDAALHFKVPKSTLNRWICNPNLKSVGAPRGLSDEVESMLVEFLEEMALWNHPIDRE